MTDAGYSIHNAMFSQTECDELLRGLETKVENVNRAGLRNLMADQMIRKFVFDSRLIDITESFSGKRLIPFKATLFAKTGKANWLVTWHQDTALPFEKAVDGDGWGPASVKEGVTFVHAPSWALSEIVALRIHLDASTESNGPLRVIPGSHKKRIVGEAEFEVTSPLKTVPK